MRADLFYLHRALNVVHSDNSERIAEKHHVKRYAALTRPGDALPATAAEICRATHVPRRLGILQYFGFRYGTLPIF